MVKGGAVLSLLCIFLITFVAFSAGELDVPLAGVVRVPGAVL